MAAGSRTLLVVLLGALLAASTAGAQHPDTAKDADTASALSTAREGGVLQSNASDSDVRVDNSGDDAIVDVDADDVNAVATIDVNIDVDADVGANVVFNVFSEANAAAAATADDDDDDDDDDDTDTPAVPEEGGDESEAVGDALMGAEPANADADVESSESDDAAEEGEGDAYLAGRDGDVAAAEDAQAEAEAEVDADVEAAASGNVADSRSAELLSGVRNQSYHGERFMHFWHKSKHYVLIYKPHLGSVRIVRFNCKSGKKGVTTTWSSKWRLGYTSLVAYRIGKKHYGVLYNKYTGRVVFLRFKAGGGGIVVVRSGLWGKGWTHIVPFAKKSRTYLLVYNAKYGWANWERVHRGNAGTTSLSKHRWIAHRTLLVPYTYLHKHYLILYSGTLGHLKMVHVKLPSGHSKNKKVVVVQTYYRRRFEKHLSHITPIPHKGHEWHYGYALVYKRRTAGARVWRLSPSSLSVTYSRSWAPSKWTHFTPVCFGGQVLVYRTTSGAVRYVGVHKSGTGVTTLWGARWSKGWY